MKFYVLASLFIFVLVIFRATKRSDKNYREMEDAFWEREHAANSVRKKPIDNLDYIRIPLDTLPTQVMAENAEVADCIALLCELSGKRILNLTGYSNTDLKLTYGTANITALSEYDQNYTLLARTLQKWAELLWQGNFREQACAIWEFALSTQTDISATYYRLAQYYAATGQDAKIDALIDAAQSLRSSNRDIIVRTLQESYR